MKTQTGVIRNNGRWEGYANGIYVGMSKTNKEYVQKKLDAFLAEHGQHLVTIEREAKEATQEVKPTVNKRFEYVSSYVRMLAAGHINSFILSGSGGIGKTMEIMDTFKALKLKEWNIDAPPDEGGDFIMMKGYATAKGLYNMLWNSNGKILILDDCDDSFKTEPAVNLLKGALDDKQSRVVDWGSQSPFGPEIPARFEYRGRIIFVSNKPLNKFPQPLISRSQKVDLSLTKEEMLERISYIFTQKMSDEDFYVKEDVLRFVFKNADVATDLNVRSACLLIPLRKVLGRKNWEAQALYSWTAPVGKE